MQFTQDLLTRAVYAYFKDRFGHPREPRPATWPYYDNSGLYRYNARDYVVLRGPKYEVLAVYRIRPSNGALRRLFNYPLALGNRPLPNDHSMYYRKKDETSLDLLIR